MKVCHKSEKINSLCEKKIEIKFFDGSVYLGILHKDTEATRMQQPENKSYDNKTVIGYYIITLQGIELHFKKSHVKSIKEV